MVNSAFPQTRQGERIKVAPSATIKALQVDEVGEVDNAREPCGLTYLDKVLPLANKSYAHTLMGLALVASILETLQRRRGRE